ncbi:hypothetical protein OO013_13630 [Mangrovivirga sp. M17]|uniref:Lipocalin-like domain-containing protein n=1 Tax=Mangrovivirga halotolerans TaxID=2993936 RepID=A0ABT3RTK2_9BACT|nr:hypothetical protein [Mangrovivirga halotolerans]MCX2744918.1 hypothetical protein [Mangrovivirga halotolerans]
MCKNKIIILLLFLFILSCKDNHSKIVGEWQAKWEADSLSYPGLMDLYSFHAEARYKFKPDGTVKIQIYGYEDCFFQSDTTTNTLYYEITGDSLILKDESTNFRIFYIVKKINSKKASFSFMEDINISLTKI